MRSTVLAKGFLLAGVAAAAIGGIFAVATPAMAEPIVSAQCSTVGDVAAQIAGWRDHHKTKAQAVAQVAKYYSDPTDRRVLGKVIDRVYSDLAPKLVPERISVEMTTACAEGNFK